ncbi:DUF3014 domain-containing protein [Simiduia agarivorans]|uniref:DUF3014 domain-containing protein n=1 Tax=Simiduia agarivorans (strain DSM 21679 / JCM 13881 / BCRC 17597 / SA1) TaxID=1117647 RepID=K4KI82_SIMAS|nr:DUF3014 domain-containing protein [Simiduia agarivorans]AFU97920.1 hypothetical protein M5M_03555 [Simiduia agarivorans SA1 = DSM 21679]
MNKKALVSIGVGLVLLAGVLFVLLRPAKEATQAVPVPEAVAPEPVVREAPEPVPVQKPVEPAPVPSPALIAPPDALADSDAVWQQVVAEVAPALVQWMVDAEHIRKWVILVDQIADGDVSNKHLPINYPMAPFAITGNKDAAVASAENYARANALINAVTKIKPETMVRYYRLWQPLFEDAYQELGKPGTFDDRVVQAIRQLQSVPPGPVDAQLAMKPVMYKYIDPKFEKAPALHKWMWRLGPDNQSRIKQYLTEVKLALYRQS